MTDLIDLPEASAQSGFSEMTLRRYIRLGILPALRTPGGRYRVDPESLKGLLTPVVVDPETDTRPV